MKRITAAGYIIKNHSYRMHSHNEEFASPRLYRDPQEKISPIEIGENN